MENLEERVMLGLVIREDSEEYIIDKGYDDEEAMEKMIHEGYESYSE